MAFFFWEAFSWGNTILSKLISAPGLTWAKSLPYFFSNISGLHFDSKSVETQRINQQEVWILVLIWISHTPLGDFITLNVSSTALSFPFTSTSPCALINVYYCHRSPEGKILTKSLLIFLCISSVEDRKSFILLHKHHNTTRKRAKILLNQRSTAVIFLSLTKEIQ